MGNVRLLSFEDLYEFYVAQGKSLHFNAAEEHANIVVQVPGVMKFEKSDKDTEGLRPVVLQACHTEENRNHSFISEDTMKAALPSFSNRPILGYIHEVDGRPEFYTHCMHEDEGGNTVYDEIPIGTVPESCNARLEYDEEKGKTYCVVNGYIYEEYSPKAIEILEREEECACSVELSVRELSYNAQDKILSIDDYFYEGVTILGKTPDGEKVEPGMEGANIKLTDFSAENNSFVYDHADLVNKIADAVAERLSDIKTTERRNETVGFEEKIEEVTEETTEVITEAETTEEEVKVVEEETSEEVADEAADETPEVVDNFDDEVDAGDDEPEDEEPEEEQPAEEVTVDDDTLPKKVTHAVTYGEVTKEFSVSLQDKIYALSTLVNDTYSEADNAWYEVTVYDEEKYVIMKDWWNDKAYKQSYKVKKDVYSLVGDRVQVYAQYLTEDEIKKLDDMRANYSSIEAKLANYEAEPQKMEILNSDEYANIADRAEFAELKKEENHFEMSIDELKAECDRQLLAYAKGNKIEFKADAEKKSVGMKQFGQKSGKKSGRYGNLFKK